MDSVLILNTNINVTTIEEVSSLLQKKESKTIAVCNTNTLSFNFGFSNKYINYPALIYCSWTSNYLSIY